MHPPSNIVNWHRTVERETAAYVSPGASSVTLHRLSDDQDVWTFRNRRQAKTEVLSLDKIVIEMTSWAVALSLALTVLYVVTHALNASPGYHDLL